MGKKKEIGKGIRALLGNIESPVSASENEKSSLGTVRMVLIKNIEVNPFQPRNYFNDEELDQLANSIKTYGLIQPITLRKIGGNQFQLISGERRFRASQKAGLEELPAYIREANDQEMLEMALVENIQRADLNAIEVAISYQRLIDECQLTHESLASRVGKNRSTITNYTRLLKLPPPIQKAVKENLLSMGHARSLAGIEDKGIQLIAFNETISKGMSVRALEKWINTRFERTTNDLRANTSSLPPELAKIKDQISHRFNHKVMITRDKSGKGSISFKFKNDEQLNQLIESFLDD